ncbi:unnamed protein product [Paramecium primaurelia]|uniref:Uncharacterized protein n=1 Tax=Paramecium primaurelia TaxID=5886 RepID=A0A8S1QIK9_PARPR|nr:unnamed protein product [Paramecium primaurelia]
MYQKIVILYQKLTNEKIKKQRIQMKKCSTYFIHKGTILTKNQEIKQVFQDI